MDDLDQLPDHLIVRYAVLTDMPALADVFRRASLSNKGDRPNPE